MTRSPRCASPIGGTSEALEEQEEMSPRMTTEKEGFDRVSVADSKSALTHEEWRAVAGLEGRYEVSNLGRVRSLAREVQWGVPRLDGTRRTRTMTGRVLAAQLNGEQYLTVTVAAPNGQETRSIHRMVCETFVGPPPFVGALCRHADDDKRHNLPGNLVWGTVKDNALDAMRNGRVARGERIGRSRITEAQAREIKALYVFRDPERNAVALGERFGVSRQIVNSIVSGKAWGWL